MSLGARIRLTRTQKGITLQELSDRSGLSKGFICQLENDKASPSLQALEKLAGGLSVPIAYLFLTATDKIHVVREADRTEYQVREGLKAEMLSARGRALKMMVFQIPPGMGAGGEGHAHEGEECHWVLEGTVRYTQGGESVVLRAGDSLHWNCFIPHRVENCGPGVARILCATSGTMEEMLECRECEEDAEDATGVLADER